MISQIHHCWNDDRNHWLTGSLQFILNKHGQFSVGVCLDLLIFIRDHCFYELCFYRIGFYLLIVIPLVPLAKVISTQYPSAL